MQNRDEDSLHGVRPTRPRRLSRSQLESMGRDTVIDLYFESDEYIRHLESSVSKSISSEERQKLKRQISDLSQRENLLVLKITLKEQQVRELQCEADTLKKRVIPQSSTRLRASLMDPTVDLLFKKMKKELDQTKKKLEETQEELSAWKFTPESNVGKRLMAQCRQLYQENEELGKRVASGRVAKLEGDLALYRSFAQEMKQNQKEQDELLLELDEEVEGMQSTIYLLEQQLREAKETVACLTEGSEPPDSRSEDVQDSSSMSNEVSLARSQNEQLEKDEPQREAHHDGKLEELKTNDGAANEADTVRHVSQTDCQQETRRVEIPQKRSNAAPITQPESSTCDEEDQATPSES